MRTQRIRRRLQLGLILRLATGLLAVRLVALRLDSSLVSSLLDIRFLALRLHRHFLDLLHGRLVVAVLALTGVPREVLRAFDVVVTLAAVPIIYAEMSFHVTDAVPSGVRAPSHEIASASAFAFSVEDAAPLVLSLKNDCVRRKLGQGDINSSKRGSRWA